MSNKLLLHSGIASTTEEQVETKTIDFTRDLLSDSYQHIQGEHLSMVVISAQVLTSSRIEASTYKKVVFSECTFYGCDFNKIAFHDCIFENCIFEFSHFRGCTFENCNFSNCTWKGASSVGSFYQGCDLDRELSELCRNGRNTLTSGRRDFSTDIYIQLALAS